MTNNVNPMTCIYDVTAPDRQVWWMTAREAVRKYGEAVWDHMEHSGSCKKPACVAARNAVPFEGIWPDPFLGDQTEPPF